MQVYADYVVQQFIQRFARRKPFAPGGFDDALGDAFEERSRTAGGVHGRGVQRVGHFVHYRLSEPAGGVILAHLAPLRRRDGVLIQRRRQFFRPMIPPVELCHLARDGADVLGLSDLSGPLEQVGFDYALQPGLGVENGAVYQPDGVGVRLALHVYAEMRLHD